MKRNVIEREITHEHYKEALFGKEQYMHKMKILRSEGHEMYGMYMNKLSISPFDTKRWIAGDGVHTGVQAQSNQAGGSCVLGGTTSSSSRTKPRLGPSDK